MADSKPNARAVLEKRGGPQAGLGNRACGQLFYGRAYSRNEFAAVA